MKERKSKKDEKGGQRNYPKKVRQNLTTLKRHKSPEDPANASLCEWNKEQCNGKHQIEIRTQRT